MFGKAELTSKMINGGANYCMAPEPQIAETLNVFPVSPGFLISYASGYFEEKIIFCMNEHSQLFDSDWEDICKMIGDGVKFEGIDLELMHQLWKYFFFVMARFSDTL